MPPNPDGPLLEESSESEEKTSTLPEIGSVPSCTELYKHTWAQKRWERDLESFLENAPPGMVGRGGASQVQR